MYESFKHESLFKIIAVYYNGTVDKSASHRETSCHGTGAVALAQALSTSPV